ncbi:MAG: glycogen synthase [Candidatus Limnocylindrales bacterium]
MRIAMVSSECEPYAKVGGLADVVDALARGLGQLGHEVDVFLPLYRGVRPPAGSHRRALAVARATDPSSADEDEGDVATVDLLTGPADGYRIRLVDHPFSYDRAGLYGETGADYPDNAARFTLLGRVALETISEEGSQIDILHGHDWEAGPALLMQRHLYASDSAVASAASVLTCHNLAYHGWVARGQAWQLELPETLGAPDGIDLLREAVAVADIVNTVSPTYAEESRTAAMGAGLDDLLRSRADRYLGIINGIDTTLWDPAADSIIPVPFSRDDLSGKQACRAELGARHGLQLGDGGGERGAPILGMIGRLDPQKGFDLLASAAPGLLEAGARIVVLGTGDPALVRGLQSLATTRPDRLVVLDRFDRDEARRIYAGADMFLMPSRFEPCGQGQMISMRYGTVPVVRATGGLVDTVRDADADPQAGTGFVFGPAEPEALVEAGRRAIAAYQDEGRWRELVQRDMALDFSWGGPAREYVAAYERAVASRRQAPLDAAQRQLA